MCDNGPAGECEGGAVEWPPTGTETARDELFRALADGRRRRVLAHLRTEGRTIPVEQIVRSRPS